MLAPRDLPPGYVDWNRRYRAPSGRPLNRLTYRLGFARPSRASVAHRGPFAWQPNNSSRAFEYPWVSEQVGRLGDKLTIVDIGGGLAGMQFVLAKEGHRVLNVDPGMKAAGVGFDLDARTHAQLAKWLGAPVTLISAPIQAAGLASESVDVVLSVSTIEHLTPSDLGGLADTVSSVLKPDGHAVFTIDLFLDLYPFTTQRENRWGANIDVAKLLRAARLDLLAGDSSQLYGFPTFDADAIARSLPELLIGQGWPTLTQLVVAQRGGR
jgi:2-polyprenyl-3-methyl-5-hydroxy-6-metoxy-1,4-benzoquinol methylase